MTIPDPHRALLVCCDSIYLIGGQVVPQCFSRFEIDPVLAFVRFAFSGITFEFHPLELYQNNVEKRKGLLKAGKGASPVC